MGLSSEMNHGPAFVSRIIDDHLREASFALERLEAGFSSATQTLDRLANGPERIFLANVAGLALGGDAVVERALAPVLAAKKPPSPHKVAAVVVAYLQGNRAPLAMRALTHDAPAVRRGAVRGCLLGAGPGLDAWVAQSLANPKSHVARPVLLELAADRGIGADSLARSLHAEDPNEIIAALRGAWRDPKGLESRVEALLDHPHAGVRDAAMIASLHHGSFEGWARCQSLAFEPRAPHPLAMALVAGLGEPGQHKRIAAMTALGSHRSAALRALGLSGNAGVIPQLLEIARSEEAADASAAREALATMVGNELDSALRDESNHDALDRWWLSARSRFVPGRRYMGGLPVTRAAFAHALTHFPGRRRYLVALLLSIRTAGASRVSTRALTATQRAQILALTRKGADDPWAREFSAF